LYYISGGIDGLRNCLCEDRQRAEKEACRTLNKAIRSDKESTHGGGREEDEGGATKKG